MSNDIIPAWVANYVGIPFDEANCYQLVRRVYEDRLDIKLPTYDGEYFGSLDKDNICRLYQREVPKLLFEVNEPLVYDMVLCRIQGQPWHVGVVVAKNRMLHTQRGLESAIERYDGLIWKNRIVGFYRYR